MVDAVSRLTKKENISQPSYVLHLLAQSSRVLFLVPIKLLSRFGHDLFSLTNSAPAGVDRVTTGYLIMYRLELADAVQSVIGQNPEYMVQTELLALGPSKYENDLQFGNACSHFNAH